MILKTNYNNIIRWRNQLNVRPHAQLHASIALLFVHGLKKIG